MRDTISLVLIALALMLAVAGVIYRPQTSESSSDNDSFPPAESATPAPGGATTPSSVEPANPFRFRLPRFLSSSFASSFSSESAVPLARISIAIRKTAASVETVTATPAASFSTSPSPAVSPEPSPAAPPEDPPSSEPIEALW